MTGELVNMKFQSSILFILSFYPYVVVVVLMMVPTAKMTEIYPNYLQPLLTEQISYIFTRWHSSLNKVNNGNSKNTRFIKYEEYFIAQVPVLS